MFNGTIFNQSKKKSYFNNEFGKMKSNWESTKLLKAKAIRLVRKMITNDIEWATNMKWRWIKKVDKCYVWNEKIKDRTENNVVPTMAPISHIFVCPSISLGSGNTKKNRDLKNNKRKNEQKMWFFFLNYRLIDFLRILCESNIWLL